VGGFRLFDDSIVVDFGVGRLMPEVLKTKKYRLKGKNPNHLFRRRTMKREHPALVLAHSGRSLNSAATWLSETLERHKGAVLAVFSIAYFALTFYRASRKLFWFDELFTVYLSRLPDFKSVWHVLVNSVDLQLVLFLLTRFSKYILGEGHIATRLPEILGFWVFCLCLFRFVSLRLSVLSACVSLLFPLVTGAYWYAYEARAHGLVLGFCGIALDQLASRCGTRRTTRVVAVCAGWIAGLRLAYT
jgi:hypothetical protein